MIETLKSELAANQQTITHAFRHKAWDELREVAHIIKGYGSSFGQPKLSQLGKEICDAIDQQQMKSITRLVMQLTTEIRSVLQKL
jgi:HPt (histidine-containing phosphotransfer) domain-containing protein